MRNISKWSDIIYIIIIYPMEHAAPSRIQSMGGGKCLLMPPRRAATGTIRDLHLFYKVGPCPLWKPLCPKKWKGLLCPRKIAPLNSCAHEKHFKVIWHHIYYYHLPNGTCSPKQDSIKSMYISRTVSQKYWNIFPEVHLAMGNYIDEK